MIQFCGIGILPVLVLLAGKMPAPQEKFLNIILVANQNEVLSGALLCRQCSLRIVFRIKPDCYILSK
jgi:hypothetical protein